MTDSWLAPNITTPAVLEFRAQAWQAAVDKARAYVSKPVWFFLLVALNAALANASEFLALPSDLDYPHGSRHRDSRDDFCVCHGNDWARHVAGRQDEGPSAHGPL
jgi:hypothetical protein